MAPPRCWPGARSTPCCSSEPTAVSRPTSGADSAGLDCVVIGPRASDAPLAARIAIDGGVAGIHEGGVAVRMDDVPLPLRPVLPSPSDTAAALGGLATRLHRLSSTAALVSQLRITGGAVHDPAQGIDGEVRDVCVENGRIVAALPADAPRLDARGMVIMPGGIDMHAHIAASSVNLGRRLLPEEHTADPASAPPLTDDAIPRSGTGGTLPSTFTTGYRYAGLGYTTVFDAAVAPISARDTHAQLDDTPILDGGFFVLVGNDEYLHRQIAAGERDRARDYLAWLIQATGPTPPRSSAPAPSSSGSGSARSAVARRSGGQRRGHPARHPRDHRQCRQRAEAAAPGAHPLQQPRRPRQRRHHARDHAHAPRAPRALHPPPVPQLRRRARKELGLGGPRR